MDKGVVFHLWTDVQTVGQSLGFDDFRLARNVEICLVKLVAFRMIYIFYSFWDDTKIDR